MEILRNNGVVINTTEKTKIDTTSNLSAHEITDLRPAVKNEKRVNIFVDDEFAFSLDISQVVDFKIKRGQKLSEEDLKKYRKASNFGKLYQRALEWVLTRPRSVSETKDYLKKKQFQKPEYEISNEDISAIISRLEEKDYLNDAKFTTYFIENRFQKKGISTRRLKMELQKKGISPIDIDVAFSSIGRNDEQEIQKLINKKRTRYQDNEKLIQYLVRQGFDFELARSSVLGTD